MKQIKLKLQKEDIQLATTYTIIRLLLLSFVHIYISLLIVNIAWVVYQSILLYSLSILQWEVEHRGGFVGNIIIGEECKKTAGKQTTKQTYRQTERHTIVFPLMYNLYYNLVM